MDLGFWVLGFGFWVSLFIADLKEKYVGNEMEESKSEQRGLNLMDKTLMVRGARISYSIWEVGGNWLNLQLKNYNVDSSMMRCRKEIMCVYGCR